MTVEIPRIDLAPTPQTPEAAAAIGFQSAPPWAGRRHRIGGTPTGMRAADYPVCRSCQAQMSFYGQLDSVGDQVCIADCFAVAVFICFDCFTTEARILTASLGD